MLLFLTLSALFASVACVLSERIIIPVAEASLTSNFASGASVPTPTEPPEVIRSLSVGDDAPSAVVVVKARAVGLSSFAWSPSASARISAHC